MIKIIREYAWIAYLGGSLAWADITVSTKEFWIVLVPTAILVTWSQSKEEQI